MTQVTGNMMPVSMLSGYLRRPRVLSCALVRQHRLLNPRPACNLLDGDIAAARVRVCGCAGEGVRVRGCMGCLGRESTVRRGSRGR
jgi:hypothetical protein